MKNKRLRLGITHGDINGISYEILLKALDNPDILDYFIPIVYGSSKAVAFYKKYLNNESLSGINFNIISSAAEANPKKINIVNISLENLRVEPGVATEMAGMASVEALELATTDLREDLIDVIVTCPINKASVYSDRYQFPGHTEYFAKHFDSEEYTMLMVSENMRVGFVTGHTPICKIAESINKELILEKLNVINDSLKKDFTIRAPRIAVLSLNPHAGDKGLLGMEEIEIISPAIEEAKSEGILAFGPYSSDGFFSTGQFSHFDAVLAMYHDQGMIPFKSLTINGGVNYTAGLPIIRTSPAHGTAYDIVGQNIASSNSLRESMFLARDIYFNRSINNTLSENPLNFDKDIKDIDS